MVAIDGMSIVNCLENGSSSTREHMTLSFDSFLSCNVQQIQFPQVEHLGNKVCEQLWTCIASFVTVRGECSMGNRHSAVGDLLVVRSVTVGGECSMGDQRSTVGDLLVVRSGVD